MRSVFASAPSRLWPRLAMVALVSVGLGACADSGRLGSPFSSPYAANNNGGDVTASSPARPASSAARIDAQPLPAPPQTRPAYSGNTNATNGVASAPPASPGRPTHSDVTGSIATPARTAANAPAKVVHHVVARGETLSSIGRHYGKDRLVIAKANHIAPDAKLRLGQQLVIPGVRPQQTAAPTPPPAPVAAKQVQTPPAQQMASNDAQATARVATPAAEAQAEAQANGDTTGSAPSFRWPVRGRVIAGFGARTNGQQNDGINLAVPEGTSIKAAEDGVVAYAGNELKGYGNLVLIRHNNGFVTAYAHASEVMVKRGDKVKRGQIIARSGQTGNVGTPQLHFEIRRGSTPVDPMQFLSGAA